MPREYEPFEIEVSALEDGRFPLRARFLGVVKESSIPGDLPLLSAEEIEQSRTWLERGFIDRPYAQDFGARLFHTLFPPEIEAFFRQAVQRVEPEGGLRLLLNQPLPEGLDAINWELLYDPGGLGFLARSVRAPLVRHYTRLPLPHELPEEGPLKILLVTASPTGKPPVSTRAETRDIAAALERHTYDPLETVKLAAAHIRRARSLKGLRARLANRRLIEMEVLAEATRAGLQNRMVAARAEGKPFHIVHFIGHGEHTDEGSFLLLQDGRISAEDFAEMMSDPSINLVVLNACETAASGLLDSAAEACLNCAVPAVIGMQVPVLDRAAVAFAREFYAAWAAGEPIESALAYARRLISQQEPGAAADWSIPILYMGPEEGLTLRLEIPEIEIPWQVRAIRWGVVTLFSLLGTAALLTQTPEVVRAIRQNVPGVRCAYPVPLAADPSFNIAIVEFNVQDANGSPLRGEDGKILTEDLFRRLRANVEDLNLPIAHDLGEAPYPCPIRGATREEVTRNAASFARKVGADVLIFGSIVQKERFGEINPEFYVDYTGFTEGLEITGEYQIGKPLRVDIPITEEDLELGRNKGLKARNAALVNLVIGLAEFSLDDYDGALLHFQAAAAEKDWLRSQGKEIAYLMIANAFARKAGQTNLLENDEEYRFLLEQADANIEEALAINPGYARGQLGKAVIQYQQALGPLGKAEFDLEKLSEVETLYLGLIGRNDLPPSANIPAKARYGLGQVYLARGFLATSLMEARPGSALPVGLNAPETEYARAEAEFQQVIDMAQGGEETLVGVASQTYASLGMIYRIREDYPRAVEYIQEAIKRASPYYRVRFYAFLGDTHRRAGDCEKALEAYQDGIAYAETLGDEKTIEQIESVIRSSGCQ